MGYAIICAQSHRKPLLWLLNAVFCYPTLWRDKLSPLGATSPTSNRAIRVAVRRRDQRYRHEDAISLRVFSIGSDGGLTEYERLPFELDHEEAVLEEWLEANPDGILEESPILIIGRQVRTDIGGFIDRPARGGPHGERGRRRVEARPHAAGRGRAGARIRGLRRAAGR